MGNFVSRFWFSVIIWFLVIRMAATFWLLKFGVVARTWYLVAWTNHAKNEIADCFLPRSVL